MTSRVTASQQLSMPIVQTLKLYIHITVVLVFTSPLKGLHGSRIIFVIKFIAFKCLLPGNVGAFGVFGSCVFLFITNIFCFKEFTLLLVM